MYKAYYSFLAPVKGYILFCVVPFVSDSFAAVATPLDQCTYARMYVRVNGRTGKLLENSSRKVQPFPVDTRWLRKDGIYYGKRSNIFETVIHTELMAPTQRFKTIRSKHNKRKLPTCPIDEIR